MTLSFTKKISRLTLLGLAVGFLAACSGDNTVERNYPDRDEDKRYKYGSVLGQEGFQFGVDEEEGEEAGTGIGVNSYLWRATLDTLSFMPITSADPFGGVILTDWYKPDASKEERFKVNAYIMDRQLKASALRVSTFKQVQNEQGEWIDQPTSKTTARQLEDSILQRARQIRSSNVHADK